jgi:hypothetical protein
VPAHSPDDEHGDISIELTEGTFLTSFDNRTQTAAAEAIVSLVSAAPRPGVETADENTSLSIVANPVPEVGTI